MNMVENNKAFKIFMKNFDLYLFILTIVTSIFGIVLIASATNSYENNIKFILVQTTALVIGILLIILIIKLDYEYIGGYHKWIYAFNILALVIVLFIGEGEQEWGGKSWIRFGSIGIQPAEIVKIGFIITFAKHLEAIKEELNKMKTLFYLLLHAGILIGLILLQPDLGTAMVFVFIFAGMIFVCGIHYRYIFAAIAAFAAFAPIAWFFLLENYQKTRILVFLNPESDPLNAGYHIIQSKISVGSGQIFGRGLFRGIQTQMGFLPEKHTDFIFAVVGEELGLIGSILVLLLLVLIIWRCISTAQIAKDDFGSFICIGVASMLIFQTFENIGMCIGLTPITGLPLPFISYGGSSLMTNLAAIGLVINVRMRRRVINF